MTARMIEEAERRLHELRRDEWSRLLLAALAAVLAVGASLVHRPLALPFFLGALTVGVLAGRTVFERDDLTHRLLLDRDAYAIPEIRRKAEGLATMENRRMLAGAVRRTLTPVPGYQTRARVRAVAEELEALACELEDERLLLDPGCAVQCTELITVYMDSPLFNELLPAEDLRVQLRQIRAGFQPVSAAQFQPYGAVPYASALTANRGHHRRCSPADDAE
jgi:hypothetical protein